jgi:Sec-independent protein translocase protein TatA
LQGTFIVSPVLNLDPAKLLVIAVVAVILLGPERLPQVARQMGAAWRTFNEFRHRIETDVRSAVPDLPSTQDISRLARSPAALLNHLSAMATEGGDTITTMTTTDADGVTTSNAGSGQGVPGQGPPDSSEADPSDIDTPPTRAPAAASEIVRPLEVLVSDPHLN